MVKWDEQWAEVLALSFLVLGFLIAVLLQSAVISYLATIMSGMLAARLYYIRRFKEPILPFILIILGFLIGYLIGSLWVSRFWTFFFFIVSFGVSYYLHRRGFFTVFKPIGYIK